MSLDRIPRIYSVLVNNHPVLGSIAIAFIAYIVNSGSIYTSPPIVVASIASKIAGIDIAPIGYLAAIILSIAYRQGSVIPVYILGLIATLAISYLALKSPEELRRYKTLETLRTVALILVAVPLSQYSWLAASILRPWDPFPLGVVILVSLSTMIIVILRGGRDLERILEPFARSPERLSRIYLYLARILTIVGSITYSIARASPAPLLLLILLIIATRIAVRRTGARDMEQIIEIPVPLTILIYMLLT